MSEQNVLRNASVRPGAAISSANTGGAQYQPTASQSIVKGLLSGIADSRVTVPKGNKSHWYLRRSSSLTHRSRPANDRFFAGADSLVADPPILGKRTFCSQWAQSYAGFVFFKQQHVARTDPERPADGKRNSNLSFRRNPRVFLQRLASGFLTLLHSSLLGVKRLKDWPIRA